MNITVTKKFRQVFGMAVDRLHVTQSPTACCVRMGKAMRLQAFGFGEGDETRDSFFGLLLTLRTDVGQADAVTVPIRYCPFCGEEVTYTVV